MLKDIVIGILLVMMFIHCADRAHEAKLEKWENRYGLASDR